jgi:hypothetical protein
LYSPQNPFEACGVADCGVLYPEGFDTSSIDCAWTRYSTPLFRPVIDVLVLVASRLAACLQMGPASFDGASAYWMS